MVRKSFKRHSPGKTTKNAVLSDADIKKMLKETEEAIEADVDRSIEDYIAHVNKDLLPMLVKALEASGNPEEAYKTWKKFSQTGNLVDLRKSMLEWKPAATRVFQMTNKLKHLEQKQDGHGASRKKAVKRTLRAGFDTASAHHEAKKTRDSDGKLNAPQEAIFDVFIYFWRLYQGPSADLQPLRAAVAPLMQEAVNKRLLSSYDKLKEEAKEPLIDEQKIRALRKKILGTALKRFEKLKEESYAAHPEPIIPDYGFSVKQMPEKAKFGIEIEGFSAIKQAFPKNLDTLAQRLQEAGLKASAALKAKHSDYSEWTITYDNSIINPMEINGRWKTPHAITAQSSSFELVSPILKGHDGHDQLKRAIKVLNDIKFKSNDTCGLHMHVSLEETTLEQKKNLVKALYNNRKELDGLVHPERRGDQNKFALAIDGIDIGAVDGASTTKELVEIINPGLNRNSKFDMTGLVSPGGAPTIQYRLAGGANYLASTSDYAIILANFTQQALDNPEVTVDNVIEGLKRDKRELKHVPIQAAKHAARPMAL